MLIVAYLTYICFMIQMEMDDFIFGNLDFYCLNINMEDSELFLETIMSNELPDVFNFHCDGGTFKVDRINKEFRIVKRNYNHPFNYEYFDLPTNETIDLSVMVAYKIAQGAGFKVFLDPKYSN